MPEALHLTAIRRAIENHECGCVSLPQCVEVIEALCAALEAAVIPHLVVDGDCWYSCPKSGECCRDDQDKDKCGCGADAHNEAIRSVLARVTR